MWWANNHTRDIMKYVGWHNDLMILRSTDGHTARVHPVDLQRYWTPIQVGFPAEMTRIARDVAQVEIARVTADGGR